MKVAKKHNMAIMETSSKTRIGVQELFRKVAGKIVLMKMMNGQ